MIIWDIPDLTINDVIHRLLECSKGLLKFADTLPSDPSVVEAVRITLLTFDGNKCAEAPLESQASTIIDKVLTLGVELMRNLFARSEALNRTVNRE